MFINTLKMREGCLFLYSIFAQRYTKLFNMKSEFQNNIIAKIRRLREEHGYSQEDLATVLGLSNGHIGNIESSKMNHKYTLSHISKICEEFHYPIGRIFLDDKDPLDHVEIVNCIINKIIKYEE